MTKRKISGSSSEYYNPMQEFDDITPVNKKPRTLNISKECKYQNKVLYHPNNQDKPTYLDKKNLNSQQYFNLLPQHLILKIFKYATSIDKDLSEDQQNQQIEASTKYHKGVKKFEKFFPSINRYKIQVYKRFLWIKDIDIEGPNIAISRQLGKYNPRDRLKFLFFSIEIFGEKINQCKSLILKSNNSNKKEEDTNNIATKQHLQINIYNLAIQNIRKLYENIELDFSGFNRKEIKSVFFNNKNNFYACHKVKNIMLLINQLNLEEISSPKMQYFLSKIKSFHSIDLLGIHSNKIRTFLNVLFNYAAPSHIAQIHHLYKTIKNYTTIQPEDKKKFFSQISSIGFSELTEHQQNLELYREMWKFFKASACAPEYINNLHFFINSLDIQELTSIDMRHFLSKLKVVDCNNIHSDKFAYFIQSLIYSGAKPIEIKNIHILINYFSHKELLMQEVIDFMSNYPKKDFSLIDATKVGVFFDLNPYDKVKIVQNKDSITKLLSSIYNIQNHKFIQDYAKIINLEVVSNSTAKTRFLIDMLINAKATPESIHNLHIAIKALLPDQEDITPQKLEVIKLLLSNVIEIDITKLSAHKLTVVLNVLIENNVKLTKIIGLSSLLNAFTIKELNLSKVKNLFANLNEITFAHMDAARIKYLWKICKQKKLQPCKIDGLTYLIKNISLEEIQSTDMSNFLQKVHEINMSSNFNTTYEYYSIQNDKILKILQQIQINSVQLKVFSDFNNIINYAMIGNQQEARNYLSIAFRLEEIDLSHHYPHPNIMDFMSIEINTFPKHKILNINNVTINQINQNLLHVTTEINATLRNKFMYFFSQVQHINIYSPDDINIHKEVINSLELITTTDCEIKYHKT